jgi:signal transduction histidine kinase
VGPARPRAYFAAFVCTTLSFSSVSLGAEVVSNSLIRLIVVSIVVALALTEVESTLWGVGLLAAAWLGVALAPFSELSSAVQQSVIGRLISASIVLSTCHLILIVLRRALRREIATATESVIQLARSQRIDSLGRLAAGTAHDFNGLLGAILLTTEEIGYASSVAEREEAVRSVKELVRQSTDLTRRLLQFARGGGESDDAHFDVRDSVDEALEAVRPIFGRRIAVTREGGSPGPAPVRGSRVEIRQIVTNLLMNAGDAIQGEGTVDVRVEVHGRDPNRVARVIVRDSGPGVDPSVQASLFEPFVSTKRTEKGTGLGLSTAQAIVERHGGTLVLDADAPKPGATFVITLPVSAAPSAQRSA